MTDLKLVPLDATNWETCARLELPAAQAHFVASNLWSIAQAQFEPGYRPRAIVLHEEVIGFLMYSVDDEGRDPTLYWIFRLMIAVAHQGRGWGGRAFELALDEVARAGAHRVRTMHKPDNDVAGRLYRKLGFVPVGTDEDGDILLEMTLMPR